jgi:metal-responsive CopG/Arc/MetJ family transcriptional regulator
VDRFTVYLDKALYAEFGKDCDAAGTSRSLVLEELMREFM